MKNGILAKNSHKGFTLIELLVVVAIIGVLSSVIFGALNTSRGKGADAAVKSTLVATRSQAEVVYLYNNSSYDNVCTNGIVAGTGVKGIGEQVLSAARVEGQSTYATDTAGSGIPPWAATCNDTTAGWAAEVPIKSGTKFWCVDSLGKSLEENSSSLRSPADGTDVTCI